MYSIRYALAVGAAMLIGVPAANAQLRRTTTTTYPDAQTLPTGTCRVWIDGLPTNRQPAPTDCETARRNQPRNSRIIYGSRPTNVYGNRDPRSIPGTRQYDPRYDPRSSQYDPRLDPHDNGRSARDREEWQRRQERDRLEAQRKQERERDKYQRKQQKEREKEWKKDHKGNGKDHDGDDDRDRRYGNRDGRYDGRGTVQQGCVDANRDGICDSAQSSTQTIPRGIPGTVPQGTTRRVCVDANRDGKCDDGGPLVRMP